MKYGFQRPFLALGCVLCLIPSLKAWGSEALVQCRLNLVGPLAGTPLPALHLRVGSALISPLLPVSRGSDIVEAVAFHQAVNVAAQSNLPEDRRSSFSRISESFYGTDYLELIGTRFGYSTAQSPFPDSFVRHLNQDHIDAMYKTTLGEDLGVKLQLKNGNYWEHALRWIVRGPKKIGENENVVLVENQTIGMVTFYRSLELERDFFDKERRRPEVIWMNVILDRRGVADFAAILRAAAEFASKNFKSTVAIPVALTHELNLRYYESRAHFVRKPDAAGSNRGGGAVVIPANSGRAIMLFRESIK